MIGKKLITNMAIHQSAYTANPSAASNPTIATNTPSSCRTGRTC
jgi:hypothetical protein